MAAEEDGVENLSKLFTEGLDSFNNVDKTDAPTNSSEVQMDIKRAMATLEKATRLASCAGLFSANESIEEVATNDIQYLMLPVLLGTLSLKLTTGDRKEIVDVAEIYFKDFLQRCNDYGLSDYTFKDQQASTSLQTVSGNQFDQLKGMIYTRQSKIKRFNEQKELQNKLKDLKENLSNEHVDEDIKRNYMLTMIKIFIYKAIEEIDSIEMEKPMLAHMEKIRETEGPPKVLHREPPRHKPLRPVIITKDEVQKAVYGLGYPSIPTMTVREFYDKRVQDGVFPDPSKAQNSGAPKSLQEAALAGVELDRDEQEQIEREDQEQDDDPVLIQRLRDKDAFKDDHRRGWGNRMNRS